MQFIPCDYGQHQEVERKLMVMGFKPVSSDDIYDFSETDSGYQIYNDRTFMAVPNPSEDATVVSFNEFISK